MTMVVNLDEYVPAPDAARMLGMNYPALWARIDRGQLPSLKVGRFHLIKKSVLLSMKENNNDYTESLDKAAG